MTKKLRRDLDEERVVLGGRAIGSVDPEWLCVGCRRDFGRSVKPDPAGVFRSLIDENADLLGITSRLLTAGFDDAAQALTRARRLLVERATELGAKVGAEVSAESVGLRGSRRDESWTEKETILAYDLVRRSEEFPPDDEVEGLAEYLGRPVGQVGRRLAALLAIRAGGVGGAKRRIRIDRDIVRRYADDDRKLRRDARAIRREWNEPLPEEREPSKVRVLQFEFWSALAAHLERHGTTVRVSAPRHSPWYTIRLGRSGFYISLTVDSIDKELSCSLVMQRRQGKSAYRQLQAERDHLEAELGELDWRELPDRQRSRIVQTRPFDLSDRTAWPQALDWCKERAEAFHRVFAPRVRSLLL